MIEQRLWGNNEQDANYFREFIRLAKKHPGSCDRVWFSLPHGFFTAEFLDKNINALIPIVKELREAKIGVSLQAGIMAKHSSNGLRAASPEDYLPLEIDGTGIGCCPRDKKFIEYQRELVRRYASAIKPDALWPDDDMGIRFVFAEPRCTCKDCMREFNLRHGYSFTKETLERAMVDDLDVREKFLEFAYEGLAGVAYEMAISAKEACPDMKMALQHGDYNGDSMKHVFAAYERAGQTEMCSRSGAGAYSDRTPMDILEKARQLEWQLSLLPGTVTERLPEIENYPHVYYGKTMHGVCLESTLYLAEGFNSLSYSAIPRVQEDFEYVEKYFSSLSKYRPYWEKLISQNKNTMRSGAEIYLPENYWNKKIPEWYKYTPASAFSNFRMGLATTFTKQERPVYLLDSGVAECLGRDEVEKLASRPTLTSGKAIKILCDRGFSDIIGACAVPYEYGNSRGVYFTEHPVNSGLTVPSFTTSPFEGWEQYILSGNIDPLTYYGSYNYIGDNEREYIERDKIADGIVTTSRGAKWAVFGYAAFTEYMSANRRSQIIKAYEYIGGVLPAVIYEKSFMELLPRSDKCGKTKSVTLVNCSIERSDEHILRINNPASNRFVFMNADGRSELLAELYDGYALVKLPRFDAWSVGTVFAEDL